MLVRRQGVDEDFISLGALIDAVVGDVDFIAIFVGIDAAGMVAAFRTAGDDEGNASLTGFGIQMIQESDGRALEMSRIGRPVAVPRRIHTFRAAPFVQVALAEITAVCVGIGNSCIIGVVLILILVLVLVFIFLTVPGRNRCRHGRDPEGGHRFCQNYSLW